jgi:indole-3-glycerol phosphate synthase
VTILDRILEDKRREVASRATEAGWDQVRMRARAASPPRGFARALRGDGEEPGAGAGTVPGIGPGLGDPAYRIIAEVKKASPSKGLIRADFDPVAIARAYERGGASALSILTDEPYFQGRLEYLDAARGAVSLPCLRKDFIIDPFQVWEARGAGADAILLILAAFDDDALASALAGAASELGMDVLWEVHDEAECDRVLRFAPALVGINNRDLRTFEVSLETSKRLRGRVPPEVLVVSESGFHRREELELLSGWGVGAFLIGESLMRAADPGAALRVLTEPGRRS